MHINKSHRARVVGFSVGFAAVLGMGCPVCAEPIRGLSGASPATGAVDASPWSNPAETPAPAGGDGDGKVNQAAGATSLLPLPIDHMAAGANEDEAWRREVASIVLDAVRPVFNDVLFGDSAQNTGQGERPESVSWAGSANRADTFNPLRSSAQIADDERLASMLMQQLIDELKPWVFAFVAVYVFGYTVKLGLDYNQWKAERQRQRVISGGRRKRHKRRPTT